MTASPTGPDFAAPGFDPCYRHPDRQTGIVCQRCSRPICGECMTPASVGFQCPRCAGAGRAGVRAPRTRFGARIAPGGGSATKAVMVTLAVVYVANFASRGLVDQWLVMFNPYVAAGQFWRLVTTGLTSGGLFGLATNLLVLYLAGRAIESELGRGRFITLYLASALGGSTLLFAFAPYSSGAVGATSAVVGLLAANAIGKRKSGEDVRGDVGLFVIIVLYSLVVGFSSFGWLTLVGGIVVGALVGVVLAYAPRSNRAAAQVVGLLGVVLLCLLGVVAKLVLIA